ncbi:hypothetical protein SY83_21195 [Paenibacillus swuensis]|uniref:DUF2306 domain-containing protein n=1 Tax=Paenibacillus swuensis TaxID=1178515 RepID=A0A172TN27_9BACL|nr:DUF2306 domain-containing protein [Paenibacillus swuensis]ANE48376.1 hypothetical protein SY83_21195 [Paenibacillus swuensis]
MSKRYFTAVAAVLLVIIYALLKNFGLDPQAESFLKHKTNLERELQVPLWLTIMRIHVGAAIIALIAGTLNFWTRLQQHRKFHRTNGYVYVAMVVIVDVTSGYMAPFATGGKVTSIVFNMVNLLWLAFTIAAIVFIRRKQIVKHRNWMLRSYMFCFTNTWIHLLHFIGFQWLHLDYVTAYTIGVYGSVLLNLGIAEAIIRTHWKFR